MNNGTSDKIGKVTKLAGQGKTDSEIEKILKCSNITDFRILHGITAGYKNKRVETVLEREKMDALIKHHLFDLKKNKVVVMQELGVTKSRIAKAVYNK